MGKFITRENLLEFIKKIKTDKKWIENENSLKQKYLIFVETQLENKKNKETKYDRDNLVWDLSCLIDDYDFKLDETDDGLETYEQDELNDLINLIGKELLPTWKDSSSRYYNIGRLIENYDLDTDELYFDADAKCIRDEEGNIWAD